MAQLRPNSILVVTLIFIVTVTEARYHFQQDETPISYNYNANPNLRARFRGNELGALSEDELETLLFLLEKVKGNEGAAMAGARAYEEPVSLNLESPAARNYYETRNKRTGHPQKKAALDWDDYFGIDKKKRSSVPNHGMIFVPPAAAGIGIRLPETTQHHKAATITTVPDVPTTSQAIETKKEGKDAARNKQNEEEMLQQFYKNMAMATNMRKRKRDVHASIPIPAIEDSNFNPIVEMGAKLGSDQLELAKPELVSTITTIMPLSSSIGIGDVSPNTKDSTAGAPDEQMVPASAAIPIPISNEAEITTIKSASPIVNHSIPATTSKVPISRPVDLNMSRGDLEKLKARLIKQIGAAYSLDQLRQLLRDTTV